MFNSFLVSNFLILLSNENFPDIHEHFLDVHKHFLVEVFLVHLIFLECSVRDMMNFHHDVDHQVFFHHIHN
jgi:hypothetical protein